MDFTLDETQQSVRQLTSEVLDREVERAVDSATTAETGYAEALWKAMAQAGLLALAMPERLGGDGLGPLETAVVLTEVGRRAAPVPALAALALGVLPVARMGTAEQQEMLLPPVVAGDGLLTAALNEPSRPLAERPATVARRDGDTLVVTGTKTAVPFAAAATRVLVPARLDGVGNREAGCGRGSAPSSHGGSVVLLVDPRAEGLSVHRTPASAITAEYTVRLERVRVSEHDILGGLSAPDTVGELRRYAMAGACALGDGVLAGALELTAQHVRTREQFGRPLATFQAVAQQIAEVYVAARTLHLAAVSAVWRLAGERDADAALDVAAYWLTEELPAALHICHHLHGGVGVDITYPLHRYYGTGKDLARFVGGADHRLERLGERVG